MSSARSEERLRMSSISVDLEMGDIWMEIYRVEKEKLVQVPISGKNGRRLSYSGFDILNFTNYNSDLIYYGMTVPFRRKIKRNSVADSMMEGNFGWENLELEASVRQRN